MSDIKKARPLKLFVWKEVLCDYEDGIMFALAEDVAHARNLLSEHDGDIPLGDLRKTPQVFTLPTAFTNWGGA